MKLCIACKHYKRSDISSQDSCLHPSFQSKPDLVRGVQYPAYCDTMRRTGRECGPDAEGFVQKVAEEL